MNNNFKKIDKLFSVSNFLSQRALSPVLYPPEQIHIISGICFAFFGEKYNLFNWIGHNRHGLQFISAQPFSHDVPFYPGVNPLGKPFTQRKKKLKIHILNDHKNGQGSHPCPDKRLLLAT